MVETSVSELIKNAGLFIKKHKVPFGIYFLLVFGLCLRLKEDILNDPFLVTIIVTIVGILYLGYYSAVYISHYSKTEGTILNLIYKPKTESERRSTDTAKHLYFHIEYMYKGEKTVKVQWRSVYRKYEIGQKLTIFYHPERNHLFFIPDILLYFFMLTLVMFMMLYIIGVF